jgi:hypothetical protein
VVKKENKTGIEVKKCLIKEIADQRYLPTRRKRKENGAIGTVGIELERKKEKKESFREHLSGWK